MAMGIYKKGQGYWTRLMSAIGFGTVILMGCVWLADNVRNVSLFGLEPVYTQAVAFILMGLPLGWLLYYVLGRKPEIVDFLIATEGEMKKVNWSTPRELMGSTWVVLCVTVILATLCFTYDQIFVRLSTWAGILEAMD